MSENIAVQGCTLTFNVGDGQKQITTQPSSVMKCDGKGVYTKEIVVTVSGYTGGQITDPQTGAGSITIKSSASSVKSEGEFVLLEGDESEETELIGTSGGGQSVAKQKVKLKISSAGQSVVKGE